MAGIAEGRVRKCDRDAKKYIRRYFMKSTKKSLLLSTLSLILCFAMLLGTTWAWFTDEVTSGVNQIKAGNLDVELLHQGKNDSQAADVRGETKLFDDITLWEPGAYVYETFTVKNVGNLALKYSMALNVASYTSYEGHDLTEVLKVKVVDTAPTSRPSYTDGVALEAWSLNSANQPLYPVGNVPTGVTGAASEKTFTVVIYWEPTDNDNLYNMNNGRPQPLSVDLGVQLVATQLEYENDSFDNTYDHDADNTLNPAAKAETALASAVVVANQKTTFTAATVPAKGPNENTTVEFEENALVEGEYKLEVTTENNLFELKSENGDNAASIDLKLYDKDGALTTAFADGKKATITTYVTKGLTLTTGREVVYTGTDGKAQPTFISYNEETGELKFSTNHFSEYQVDTTSAAYIKETDLAYGTFEKALIAANATKTPTTVVMLNDCSYTTNGTGLWNITNSVTLEGMGHSLTGYGSRSGNYTTLAINNGGSEVVDVTLKNLTIHNSGAAGRPIETRGNIGTINFDNVTINATGGGNTQGLTVGGSQTSKAVINIKDSAINAGSSGYPIITFNPVTLNITDSDFTGYCGIYFKEPNSSAGSFGSVVTATNSKFDAPNDYDGYRNGFGVFVMCTDNIKLNLTDCKINGEYTGTALQAIFFEDSACHPQNIPNEYHVYGDATVINGVIFEDDYYYNYESRIWDITAGQFKADPSAFVADGYQAVDNGNGVWTVKPAN